MSGRVRAVISAEEWYKLHILSFRLLLKSVELLWQGFIGILLEYLRLQRKASALNLT